jgi:hypothetical protein
MSSVNSLQHDVDFIIPILYADRPASPARNTSSQRQERPSSQTAPCFGHVRPPEGVPVLEMKSLLLDLDFSRLPTSTQRVLNSRKKRRICHEDHPLTVPRPISTSPQSASNSLADLQMPPVQFTNVEIPDVCSGQVSPVVQSWPARRRPLLRKRPADSLLLPVPASEVDGPWDLEAIKPSDIVELSDVAFRSTIASNPRFIPRSVWISRAGSMDPLEAIAPGLWSPGYLPVRLFVLSQLSISSSMLTQDIGCVTSSALHIHDRAGALCGLTSGFVT